jgi:dsRNA-gated channel SID-1
VQVSKQYHYITCIYFYSSAGTDIFVSDLSEGSYKELRRSSQKYLTNFWIAAFFYALPVVQLVLAIQRTLNDTGNMVNLSSLFFFTKKCNDHITIYRICVFTIPCARIVFSFYLTSTTCGLTLATWRWEGFLYVLCIIESTGLHQIRKQPPDCLSISASSMPWDGHLWQREC